MSTCNNLKSLLDSLVDQTKVWGNAIEEGESKLANKKDSEAINTMDSIRLFGDKGQEELLELIEHEHRGVQFWAASYSMRYDLEKSLEVLKRLSEEEGAIALSATLMLKLYSLGELNIP